MSNWQFCYHAVSFHNDPKFLTSPTPPITLAIFVLAMLEVLAADLLGDIMFYYGSSRLIYSFNRIE